MDENLRREDLAVHVRRDNVFEDSFRELHFTEGVFKDVITTNLDSKVFTS